MFIIEKCKREEYIKAWNSMYLSEKDKYNKNSLFDGINPSLNKNPLSSETDNFCTVAYDDKITVDGFQYGKPIGLFSFVVTPSKVIGKQYIVHPDYMGKGLGKALLIENEKTLKKNGHDKYYIGCSICSASILKKYWKVEPFNSNVEKDLYKFNVDLNRENFDSLYNEIVVNNENIKIVANNEVSLEDSSKENDHVDIPYESQPVIEVKSEDSEQGNSVNGKKSPIIPQDELYCLIGNKIPSDVKNFKKEIKSIKELSNKVIDKDEVKGNTNLIENKEYVASQNTSDLNIKEEVENVKLTEREKAVIEKLADSISSVESKEIDQSVKGKKTKVKNKRSTKSKKKSGDSSAK